jgi:hypothetical protein
MESIFSRVDLRAFNFKQAVSASIVVLLVVLDVLFDSDHLQFLRTAFVTQKHFVLQLD